MSYTSQLFLWLSNNLIAILTADNLHKPIYFALLYSFKNITTYKEFFHLMLIRRLRLTCIMVVRVY